MEQFLSYASFLLVSGVVVAMLVPLALIVWVGNLLVRAMATRWEYDLLRFRYRRFVRLWRARKAAQRPVPPKPGNADWETRGRFPIPKPPHPFRDRLAA